MHRSLLLGTAASALLMATAPGFAHHPSGAASTGGAGPINTISATTLEAGQSSASIMFEMIKISPFSDDQLKTLAGAHIHAHSMDAILAPTAVFAYGVTSDLTVIARLPYVIRTNIREGEHHHGGPGNLVVERGDAAGIGDLTLLAQYRFFTDRNTKTEAAVLLGVKAPTGRTGVKDGDGERFEAEFQPGTGSWDGLAGLALTQRFGLWSFDASALYVLATEGALETNLGNRLQYNVAVSYRLMGGALGPMYAGAMPDPMYHGGPKRRGHAHHHEEVPARRGPALDLVLELNGEWHDKTTIAGVKDANSGGNVVYLAPGLRYSMDKWSSFVSVGVPIVNELNGIQAEPDWRLLTGISVNF
jgi:hypothetical protein